MTIPTLIVILHPFVTVDWPVYEDGASRHLLLPRIHSPVWRKILTAPRFSSALYEMYIPYRIKRFLDEYGPIVVDVVLGLPFVRLFRAILTRYRNDVKITQNRPSICRLPAELILEICSIVYISGCQTPRRNRYRRNGISDPTLALLNFSMTSKRMRAICAPVIFKHVKIGPNFGWRRAFRSLEAADRSQYGQEHAKSFSVKLGPRCDNIGHPPKRFAPRLALSLQKYDRMRNLKVEIPNYSAAAFQKAFERIDVNLPSVRVLILSAHLEWLIRMCPDVEVVSTSGVHWLTTFNDTWPNEQPFEFVRAAGRALKLRHFEMHGYWSIGLVQTVLEAMPNIQSLSTLR